MQHKPPVQPSLSEFSRWQEVEKIPPRGMEITITATPEECAAVAKRLRLLALPKLSATLSIKREAESGTFQVAGRLLAEAVQECVVTLSSLPARLDEPVEGLFMPPQQIPADYGSLEITDALDEVIEPIINGAIDVGELVVQHLVLALDPYPRVANERPMVTEAVIKAEETKKPFADLAVLLAQKQNNNKK